MIIYDCEIIKAIRGKIRGKNDEPIDGIEYCGGWGDFENMGISVIGAYDYSEARYRVFCKDNFNEFQYLIDSTDTVIGFNNHGFDDMLCGANGIKVPREKSYDLLVEIWRSAGLGTKFQYPSHMGFGLDACCSANFKSRKSGHGAMAPVDWQRGNIGSVIDYCVNDVKMTKQLMDKILVSGIIIDPRDSTKTLRIRRPE